jgi:uncharacterized protein YqiB (DUF1249 family)
MDNFSRKKKYVPSLPRLINLCEKNYGRFMRLLPDCDSESLSYSFQVHDNIEILINIISCSRYTTELEVYQQVEGPDFLKAKMRVRLYHDATAAEVTSFQNIGNFLGAYPYPNKNMLHQNEKEQLNFFLSEWLSFCQSHNRAVKRMDNDCL